MNKIIIYFLAIVFSACTIKINDNKQREKIIVCGSNTLSPIIKEISVQFNKEHPNVMFSLSSGGSNTGFEALKNNKADIATSSREMREEEVKYFSDKNIGIIEEVIAYDALAIIVHPSNPISKLTLNEIKRIFSGELTNWRELGGPNKEILIIRRDSSKSGTDDFFNTLLLGGKEPAGNVVSQIYNEEIIKDIMKSPYSIAYMGYGYLNKNVKTIALSIDGREYYFPEKKSIQNLKYPIIRPLYIYYREDKREKNYQFIHYILSKTGQNLVEKVNYIPRKIIERTHLHLPPI